MSSLRLYRFVTRWPIHAPIEAVWDALDHSERWPQWWRGLERVEEREPGNAQQVGCVRRFTWKGRLPYALVVDMRVTRVERPCLLESVASGELEGLGRWSLSEENGSTVARYDWNVRTAKRWMNRLAPLARPLFAWNHDVIMRWGEQGLKALLERSTYGRSDDAMRVRKGSWMSPTARMPSTRPASVARARALTGMDDGLRGASRYIRLTTIR